MLSVMRARAFSGHFRRLRPIGALAMASLAAACSADIGRFDFPAIGMSSDSGKGATGSLKVVQPPPGRQSAGLPPPMPMHQKDDGISVAPLPGAPGPIGGPSPKHAAQPVPHVGKQAALEPLRAAPSGAATLVEVQAGDSIYAIARRHNVSINELMTANNLTNPTIRPGQKLQVPAGGRRPVAKAAAPKVIAEPKAAQPIAAVPGQPQPAIAAGGGASNWTATHTLTPGESLYAIARRHRVTVAELQRVNAITEPTRIRAGHTLKVPGPGQGGASAAAPGAVPPVAQVNGQSHGQAVAPAPVPRAVAKAPDPVAQGAPQAAPKQKSAAPQGQPQSKQSPHVTVLNPGAGSGGAAAPAAEPAQKRVAALDPESKGATISDASPAPAPAQGKGAMSFRWPVKGRVIANFGPRANSTHNDGINIAVPSGTEVVASEAGVVAYAGSELKGYGNLVLVRHEGNWVTAYAHNDELLVKRGDRVRRGQSIARAGRSGTVDQPQVHFEIRQGSRPVDPMPLLDRQ